MKLSEEELEFLKKYRKLNEDERETVNERIRELDQEQRKRGFTLEKGGKHDARTD